MMRHQEVTFAAGSIPRLEFPIAVEMSPRKRYSKQSGTLRNKSGESLATSSSLTMKRKVNNIAEELKEKLRPVLEHRMPTLATKAAFTHPGDDRSALVHGTFSEGMSQLEQDTPPRNMRDVRVSVSKEIKSLTRKVAKLEREYYSDNRTVHIEVEKYIPHIKAMMKALWILSLNKASEVEEMLKQGSNPERYKEDLTHLEALREVYAKVQAFLPDKISGVVETCQGLLNSLNRYCVSFYNPHKDCYLETAAHYTEQIAIWREKATHSIQSARNLYKKFRTTGINQNMLSSPVAAFCSRCDVSKILFVVMFADACTHIRNALAVMTLWLQADENYATFVKNDLTELEKLREDKTKLLRDLRQKCHTLTYKLNQLEMDHSKMSQEVAGLQEKGEALRIEEVSLVNQLNELELEIEFKEMRRERMKKRSASDYIEPTAETFEILTADLKSLKSRLPLVLRQLDHNRLKLGWVDEKTQVLEKLQSEISATRKELKNMDAERKRKEQDFMEIESAAQLAKNILLCKTTSDSVEKLYYSMPVGARTAKAKVKVKDPIERACRIICSRIEHDWVQLYRNLNFYPQRGAETIERDIVELRESSVRASDSLTARNALKRWRRYHTRSTVNDLRQALKKIKRLDIIHLIDGEVKSPPSKQVVDPFEKHEEIPPPVEAKLVPFYKLIERYDQIRASRVK